MPAPTEGGGVEGTEVPTPRRLGSWYLLSLLRPMPAVRLLPEKLENKTRRGGGNAEATINRGRSLEGGGRGWPNGDSQVKALGRGGGGARDPPGALTLG